MKFPLLNIDGTKSESIEVSDKMVKLKVNHKLIKFVIDWQLNHAKPRTAKTKQRNEIRGSTVKIVAQKGSGGARHASRKAPLFVGGGIAHDTGSSLMEMHRSRSQAERKPPKRPRRNSFSPFEPRIVPAGTGTLASPRQVAGSLHLADRGPLLMLR